MFIVTCPPVDAEPPEDVDPPPDPDAEPVAEPEAAPEVAPPPVDELDPPPELHAARRTSGTSSPPATAAARDVKPPANLISIHSLQIASKESPGQVPIRAVFRHRAFSR
jgi:hypothetical protein